jgi:hypothetical protein
LAAVDSEKLARLFGTGKGGIAGDEAGSNAAERRLRFQRSPVIQGCFGSHPSRHGTFGVRPAVAGRFVMAVRACKSHNLNCVKRDSKSRTP